MKKLICNIFFASFILSFFCFHFLWVEGRMQMELCECGEAIGNHDPICAFCGTVKVCAQMKSK